MKSNNVDSKEKEQYKDVNELLQNINVLSKWAYLNPMYPNMYISPIYWIPIHDLVDDPDFHSNPTFQVLIEIKDVEPVDEVANINFAVMNLIQLLRLNMDSKDYKLKHYTIIDSDKFPYNGTNTVVLVAWLEWPSKWGDDDTIDIGLVIDMFIFVLYSGRYRSIEDLDSVKHVQEWVDSKIDHIRRSLKRNKGKDLANISLPLLAAKLNMMKI